MAAPLSPDAPRAEPTGSDGDRGRARVARPLPWTGEAERADRILIAGIILSGLLPLVLLPAIPALVSSHPALLELVRGSTASIINMGARARVGEASIVEAVLLGIPSLMMFDWVYWWAGRRWGDGVFAWLLGGESPKTEQRIRRLHRAEARFGPFAVVLAYVLPIPSALIYAAVGEGGMRLGVFLLLDVLGTLLWTSLLTGAGYAFGHDAIDVAHAVSRYGLWATIALVIFVMVRVRVRGR